MPLTPRSVVQVASIALAPPADDEHWTVKMGPCDYSHLPLMVFNWFSGSMFNLQAGIRHHDSGCANARIQHSVGTTPHSTREATMEEVNYRIWPFSQKESVLSKDSLKGSLFVKTLIKKHS